MLFVPEGYVSIGISVTPLYEKMKYCWIPEDFYTCCVTYGKQVFQHAIK